MSSYFDARPGLEILFGQILNLEEKLQFSLQSTAEVNKQYLCIQSSYNAYNKYCLFANVEQ